MFVTRYSEQNPYLLLLVLKVGHYFSKTSDVIKLSHPSMDFDQTWYILSS